MPLDDLLREGEHVMTVCNACRYCEGYCPVFPAMEQQVAFARGDLTYLANLCHNCGECLYACQYAPPHEFGINVPATLARIRLRSYEEYSWPKAAGAAFRHHGVATTLAVIALLTGILAAPTALSEPGRLWAAIPSGDFYSVVSHRVMVAVFGVVAAFAATALVVGVIRFWRDGTGHHSGWPTASAFFTALREATTLTHLHGDGVDCTDSEEHRSHWRRWFHHATFYGFGLCFLSTTVAAFYHVVLGWHAPYGYASLPVVLGTVGGVGLVVGPAGLLALKRRRDPALGDAAQKGLDASFILQLGLTSVSGLALLALRTQPAMPGLLLLHLGCVLTLFVSMPYGKFVHGIYRTAALVKSRLDVVHPEPVEADTPLAGSPTVAPHERPLTGTTAHILPTRGASVSATIDG
jgi:citrate/tricarballylate utilization protein